MDKVLIGILTYDGQAYCRKYFFNFLQTLSYPEIEFLFVTNSGAKDKDDLEQHAEALRKIAAIDEAAARYHLHQMSRTRKRHCIWAATLIQDFCR